MESLCIHSPTYVFSFPQEDSFCGLCLSSLEPSLFSVELFLLHALALRCNGYSLLLNSYLSRISRNENPSCSACGHPIQDTTHLILYRTTTDPALHAFRRLLFYIRFWSEHWWVAWFLELHGLLPRPNISRKESGINNNDHCNIVLITLAKSFLKRFHQWRHRL